MSTNMSVGNLLVSNLLKIFGNDEKFNFIPLYGKHILAWFILQLYVKNNYFKNEKNKTAIYNNILTKTVCFSKYEA